MNLTLRARFFLLLMGFMLFCFALNFSADIAHDHLVNLVEGRWHHPMPVNEFFSILAMNLALMPLVLSLGWWLARRMAHPVVEAAEIANRIAAGQLTERMPLPRGPSEMVQLIQALNQAFDRYDRDLERMRRFSAHAAHQLRTPVAALRAQVEVTLNRPRSPTEYQESLHIVLERLQAWSQSIEQLLALAELEAGDWSGRFGVIEVASVLHRVQEGLSILAEEKEIRLENDTAGATKVMGDDILLEQLFANILDNAIRFTPAGGSINCSARNQPESGRVVVRISDTGPGIPPAQRLQVLERFNKGVRSDSPGAGLGLAIAVEIARIHKASLTILDHAPSGTVVEIVLPGLPAQAAVQKPS